jgi:hypothetical protein
MMWRPLVGLIGQREINSFQQQGLQQRRDADDPHRSGALAIAPGSNPCRSTSYACKISAEARFSQEGRQLLDHFVLFPLRTNSGE